MKINLETIQKLNPCQDRLDNYKNNYDTNDFPLEEFLNLDKITYTDKVWVVTKLFTKKQNVLWSIKCAESVLHLFENEFPEDKRPRDAIEAAKAWTIKQDDSTTDSAANASWSAANASWSAADYTSWSASDYAARSAARSASWAARSATATDSAAKSADSAARSASWSASWSTESAESADWFAEKQQEELNLKFMLEVYNETKGE